MIDFEFFLGHFFLFFFQLKKYHYRIYYQKNKKNDQGKSKP